MHSVNSLRCLII